MLVAISAAAGLGEIVSAFDILPLLFYPYMLLLSSLLFIIFGKEKSTGAQTIGKSSMNE